VGGTGHSGSEVENTLPTFPPKFLYAWLLSLTYNTFGCLLKVFRTIFLLAMHIACHPPLFYIYDKYS